METQAMNQAQFETLDEKAGAAYFALVPKGFAGELPGLCIEGPRTQMVWS